MAKRYHNLKLIFVNRISLNNMLLWHGIEFGTHRNCRHPAPKDKFHVFSVCNKISVCLPCERRFFWQVILFQVNAIIIRSKLDMHKPKHVALCVKARSSLWAVSSAICANEFMFDGVYQAVSHEYILTFTQYETHTNTWKRNVKCAQFQFIANVYRLIKCIGSFWIALLSK